MSALAPLLGAKPTSPGASEIALEGLLGAVGLAFGIYVQHDLRDLAPVGTFRVRIGMRM
jgi:hypothetical protein